MLARHLARTAQARLVLLGRSAFPERHRWDDWLATHPEGDPTGSRIRQLRAIEELGSEVLVLAADVADHESMRRALRVVDDRFGELHGIIHGAGAVGVETFREIGQATTADAEVQFAAKVRGLLVLNELLDGRPLDFVLLLSSLSAVLGGLGFCAYSAANLFMDAFARRKNRAGGTPWTSVDWESWRLADVDPVIAGLGATVSEFAMEPEEGSDACERILAEGHLCQVVLSSGDLAARLRQWVDREGPSDRRTPTVTLHERPNLMTPYQAPRGELEREIAEIWQELFGITSPGVHDNFFELGGHSLLATQLNARLSARLHVELSLAAVLQAPTIAELALAVVRAYAEDTDSDELEKILAQLEQ